MPQAASHPPMQYQEVPDWETILALYSPYVFFFAALFNGNLATTLSTGALQFAFLCLVAIILLNLLFRTVKFEHGFALLVYEPVMRLGNIVSTMVFLYHLINLCLVLVAIF